MARNVSRPMLDAGVRVEFVNPKYDEVFGQRCYPSLRDVPAGVDAVVAMVRADLAPDVVAEAAEIGAGGVVIFSAGFGESGPDGAAIESRLVAAAKAGGLAVCGPNCTGLVTVRAHANLYPGPRPPLKPGGVGVISHSGAMLSSCMNAGYERGIGFSSLISSGNEAVTSTLDYLDFLIDDDDTDVICLVLERAGNADELFRTSRRAAAAGKRLLVLKLGRTSRAIEIAKSHTGSLLGEAWAFDVAARDAGVILTEDIDDLFDKAALLSQVPVPRRPRNSRVAILSTSGGMAALSSDLADACGVELPALDDLKPWLEGVIPGTSSPNPLDLTGFLQDRIDVYIKVVERYLQHPEVDVVAIVWPVGDGDEAWSRDMVLPLRELSERSDKLLVLCSAEAGRVGGWVGELAPRVLVGRGLRGALRGVAALDSAAADVAPRGEPATLIPLPTEPFLPSHAGPLVPYHIGARILEDAGVPLVRTARIDGRELVTASSIPAQLGDRLVIKLADVPHRTELKAVRLDVPRADAAGVIEELRALARGLGVPDAVLVQPQVHVQGELFVGAQIDRDAGPVVLLGIGGIHVELLRDVAAAPAPLRKERALAMVDDLRLGGILRGARGTEPWDLDAIADLVVNVGQVAAGAREWLGSLDLNPVVRSPDGLLAVDAVLLAKQSAPALTH